MSKKVNILIAINTLNVGGFERDVVRICEFIDHRRFNLHVATLHPNGAYAEAIARTPAKLTQFDIRQEGIVVTTIRMLALARTNKCQILHALLPDSAILLALVKLASYFSTKLVVAEGSIGDFRGLRWFLFRNIMRYVANAVTANSGSVRQFLISKGIEPKAILVIDNIHSSADYEGARLERNILRTTEILKGRSRLSHYSVGFVGRLIASKSVHDAIYAIRDLVDRGFGNISLVVVGDGPDRMRLELLVKELDLADHVSFLGTRSDVILILKTLDAFIFPSLVEGMPNALIEAAYLGLPIIAADIPAVRELLGDGKGGVIVEPNSPTQIANAVEDILLNPESHTDKCKWITASVIHRFDHSRVVPALEAMYSSLALGSK